MIKGFSQRKRTLAPRFVNAVIHTCAARQGSTFENGKRSVHGGWIEIWCRFPDHGEVWGNLARVLSGALGHRVTVAENATADKEGKILQIGGWVFTVLPGREPSLLCTNADERHHACLCSSNSSSA